MTPLLRALALEGIYCDELVDLALLSASWTAEKPLDMT